MRKTINKIAKKQTEGKCQLCGESDYAVLDCHRIVPGEDGGEYSDFNTVVLCSNCHRKVHDGQIVMDRKYQTLEGRWVLRYTVGDEEKWA